jgi:hypothetical protein
MREARVALLEDRLDARGDGFLAGAVQLVIRKVNTRNRIPAPGQFKGMTTGAAADVEDADVLVRGDLRLDEVHFLQGALGEAFTVVRPGVVGKTVVRTKVSSDVRLCD